jgi:hypothetical protein
VDDKTFIFHSFVTANFFPTSCSGFLFKIAIDIVGLIDIAFVCVQLQRSGGNPGNFTVRVGAANTATVSMLKEKELETSSWRAVTFSPSPFRLSLRELRVVGGCSER